MKGGTIVESGSYNELSNQSDSQFKDFLEAFKASMAGEYNSDVTEEEDDYILPFSFGFVCLLAS